MNYVVIFAGGVGARMGSAIPKQFLKVDNKPVIIHTIEHFDKHPYIDGIIVVCNEAWIDYCREQIKRYHIKKVYEVIPGGETGQLSIFNGLTYLENKISKGLEDDIVLIHDGVRPMITQGLITDSINTCKEKGNSIAVSKAIETIIRVDKNGRLKETVDRAECRYAKAPQCFYIKDLLKVHKDAYSKHNYQYIDSATLMSAYGYELYTTECSSENIKITTPNDFYTFKALYKAGR